MAKRIPTAEGTVLRSCRLRKGLSREEFGQRAGISADALERLETGQRPLSHERLVFFLGLMGIPPGAADAALFADRLAHPDGPTRAPSPADPIVEEAVAAGLWAGAKAARQALKADRRRRRAPAARAWAKKMWSRLKEFSPEKLEKAIEAFFRDDRSWALAVRISLASEAAAADRAADALRLARLAVRLAEHDPWEETFVHRLLGWVKPFESNAHRVGGNFPAAAEAFARADELWALGEGGDSAGLLDTTRRLDLKASLLMYQDGQAQEAISLIEQALTGTKSNHARARLLLKSGRAQEILGEHKDALETLRKAEPLIDHRREPRLAFALQFNRAVNYCGLGRWREAEMLLPEVEALLKRLGTELDERRVLWLRGRTRAGLDRREEALRALSQVRQYFLSQDIAYDFAVVGVEMAEILLQKGQTRLVQEIAKAMAWIFQGQRVHKEALAALTLFCEAAEAEEADAEWTRRLVKYLYRAQYNSKLQFEG